MTAVDFTCTERRCLRCRQYRLIWKFPQVVALAMTMHGSVPITHPRNRSTNICNDCHEKIHDN